MKNNPLRDFFHFSKSDRRAILALGCITIFCIGVMLIVDAQKEPQIAIRQEIENQTPASSQHKIITPPICNVALHSIDPNTVDSLTLIQCGIKPWKVKNFLHYRAAGKVFRSAKDLRNTYGWTDEDIEKLIPYLYFNHSYTAPNHPSSKRIYSKGNDTTSSFHSHKFQTLTPIDANSADSVTLCRIPGIGAKISHAILRYRTHLGGFYSTHQLLEIGIFPTDLQSWFIISDSFTLNHIPINHSSFQTLSTHPYITSDQARHLHHYIHLYGNISDESALRTTNIFTEEEVDRLAPYIIYDD